MGEAKTGLKDASITAGSVKGGKESADSKKMTREVDDAIHNGREFKAPEGTEKLSPRFDGQKV